MPYQERHIEALPPLTYDAEEPRAPSREPAEKRLLITIVTASTVSLLAAVAISAL